MGEVAGQARVLVGRLMPWNRAHRPVSATEVEVVAAQLSTLVPADPDDERAIFEAEHAMDRLRAQAR
jgi:hypothetical protein